MTDNSSGKLTWDLDEVARALKISPADVRAYFTDGRRVSFILERRLAKEVLRGSLAKSEGAGYNVMDSQGGLWEVRSLTRGGVFFCPSYMVGKGRVFDEPGFVAKLVDLKGYILADVESFPDVPFWLVPVEAVRTWWQTGKLGAGTKTSRDRVLKLLAALPDSSR